MAKSNTQEINHHILDTFLIQMSLIIDLIKLNSQLMHFYKEKIKELKIEHA